MRHVIAVLVIVALAACRNAVRDEESRASERADVVASVERYVAASRTVNPDSIAAFFATDGVLLEPGIPPIRTADSIRMFMGSFPGVVVESAGVALDTVEMHDSSAYVWGTYFERLHFPGQPRSEQRGRFVMHFVRASDAWRIRRYYRIPVTTVVPPTPPISLGRSTQEKATMAKITGIGGVFFKSQGDGKALAAWYRQHLGLALEPFGGAILRWPDDKAEDDGLTVWHVASSDTKWFSPSQSSFMINYRVDNLGELLEQLRAGGVEVIQGPESHENGRFAWIMDPDGNKVELWEPKLWDDKNKGA